RNLLLPLLVSRPPRASLFPYTTLFRSSPGLRCSTWSKVSWSIESIIVVLSGSGRFPGRGGRAAEGGDLGRRRWSAHQGTQSRQNRAQNVRSLSVAGSGTAPKAGPNAQVRGHLQPWPLRLGTHR